MLLPQRLLLSEAELLPEAPPAAEPDGALLSEARASEPDGSGADCSPTAPAKAATSGCCGKARA
eukprot:13546099-Alexandrium_andersonii.AAC.1